MLRVAAYSGYGREVGLAAFLDPLAKPHNPLLMDALEVDLFVDKSLEFSSYNIVRELNKCSAVSHSSQEVETGRGGDR